MIKKIGIGIGGVLVALIVIGLIVGPQKPKKTRTKNELRHLSFACTLTSDTQTECRNQNSRA